MTRCRHGIDLLADLSATSSWFRHASPTDNSELKMAVSDCGMLAINNSQVWVKLNRVKATQQVN